MHAPEGKLKESFRRIFKLFSVRKGEKNKAAITVLSIAANVVSKYTSMVGVDFKSKKKVVDSMVQRQVPLMMSPHSAVSGIPYIRSTLMCR